MKKLLLTLLAAVTAMTTWADIKTISSDYTFIASDYTGTAMQPGTQIGDYILTAGGNNIDFNNKGNITDGDATYTACLHLKNDQRQITFSVSGACTITIYGNSNSSRYFALGTESNGEDVGKIDAGAKQGEINITEENANKTLYLSTKGGDLYLAAFKITGLGEAVVTQYSKPLITVGSYDGATATWAVTLKTQNGEDGTISYAIGDNTAVTESGTVINVACNTAISAKVTGDTYSDSEENTVTTPDMPTIAQAAYTIDGFDFVSGKYTVSFTGNNVTYTINDGEDAYEYTEHIEATPGNYYIIYNRAQNYKNAQPLTIQIPAAPTDGTSSTPTTKGTYKPGQDYYAGTFLIPGNYIADQISSGSSSINGSIKMNINRAADSSMPKAYGFHIDVASGCKIKDLTLTILSNYADAVSLSEVYVDGKKLESFVPFTLKHASAQTVAADVKVFSDINATESVTFVFKGTPKQAQVLLSATSQVPQQVYTDAVEFDSYATLYYEKELKIPAGTRAYTGQLKNNKLVLTELHDVIPAGTAVIINGEGGMFEVSNTGAAKPADNDLEGVTAQTATSTYTDNGYTVYVLSKENDKVALYRYTGANLGAHKAFIKVRPEAVARISALNFQFDDGLVTGIESVGEAAQKADAPAYNVAGQLTSAKARGIVIVDGKKVINM